MKDDYEFNFKFIDLVKLRPCLYDSTRPDYKSNNRTSQDTAWLEIATEVEESVTDCKEKWKNLRACYSRHLKNSNRSTPTGKHSKPYYLAESLSFLFNFTKTKPPNENNKSEDSKNELVLCEDTIDDDQTCKLETPESNNKSIKKSRRESKSHVNVHEATTSTAFVQTDQETTTREEKCPEFLATMCPDLAFLFSLLPDMKEMNRTQKRKFKMGILSLTSDIFQENDITSEEMRGSREESPEGYVPPKTKNIRTY